MPEALGNFQICMAEKANMEAIFHSVADGILTVDTDLRIMNINRSAREMLGVSEEKAIGARIGSVLHGRLWDVAPTAGEAMRGEGVRERENVLARADGSDLRALFGANRLVDRAGKVVGAVVILRDITHLRELEIRLGDRTRLHALVGRSLVMQELYTTIERVAPTDSTVLIQGESGTGKELIADAIHRSSRRQERPFIKVNCSALSESLLESELFGHVKGAFTGATHDRKGRFEMGDGGTVFLDEIGDLTERIQVKLLRVLQEREIERVGDTHVVKIDVRILAATHQPLRKLIEEGRFRQDLFYRLNVIPIQVPPLRERKEDIPALAAEFLRELGERMGRRLEKVSRDVLRAMMDYSWPGNVRELRNVLEHAAVKGRGRTVMIEDLPAEFVAATATVSPRGGAPSSSASRGAPDDDRRTILDALERARGHRGRAAELLGVDRTTLWRKMRRLGIETETD